jgi:outer membrane biosynthesis protein TonB
MGQQAHVTLPSPGAPGAGMAATGAPAPSGSTEDKQEDKQKAVEAQTPPVPADSAAPPPSPTEVAPKTAAAKETPKTSARKKPVVVADKSPAPQSTQVESQPVVSVPQPPTTRQVAVKSDQAWTDTGIDLSGTDTAAILASGKIRVVADPRLALQQPGGFYPHCARAKELFGQPLAAVPAPNLNCWSLIGRVGPAGTIFEIGVQGAVPARSAGRLFLGVNDDNYTDNAGAWSAVITVEHH